MQAHSDDHVQEVELEDLIDALASVVPAESALGVFMADIRTLLRLQAEGQVSPAEYAESSWQIFAKAATASGWNDEQIDCMFCDGLRNGSKTVQRLTEFLSHGVKPEAAVLLVEAERRKQAH